MCRAVNDEAIAKGALDLCAGVDFPTTIKLHDTTGVGGLLLGCVLSKAKSAGKDKILKGVDDETLKKLIQDLIDQAEDKIKDNVSSEDIGYRIHANCENGEPVVRIYFKAKITVAGIEYEFDDFDAGEIDKKGGKAKCGIFYRALRGMCSCPCQ